MPALLALLAPAKLALYGAIALAALGAWGMWEYRGAKIDRLERENAAHKAEIISVAEDANRNAAAAARIKQDWQKADALAIARDKELRDARASLQTMARKANSVAPSACGPSPNGIALSRELRGPANAVDSAPNRTDTPRPSSKPARG